MKEKVLRWVAAILLNVIIAMLFGIYLATGNSLWFIGVGFVGILEFLVLCEY